MEKKYITDSITIIQGITDGSGETGTNGQVLSSTGTSTAWIDQSGASKPYFKTKLTESTTINVSTIYSTFSVFNESPEQNSGFTVTSTNITPPSLGVYAVDVMVYYTSSSARVSVGLQVGANGTFTGEEAAMGYIRASSGHNQSSLTWSSIVEIVEAKGEIGKISLGFARLGNAGTCTLDSTKSMISVYKIS
tara:strand:- start:404 stop:979 length:576 start_codon:yes stop_codon:yes gene_type:complete